MAMIDTCLDARYMYTEAIEQHVTTAQELLESRLDALLNDAAASAFLSWMDGLGADPNQRLLTMWILDDSVPPASVHLLRRGDPESVTKATALREKVMCDRLLALCGGSITGGKPRKRIVAVVGAAHVLPLRELLLAAGSIMEN